MPWSLPFAFFVAIVVMIYAAVLAFRGEIYKPVCYIAIAASVLWLGWELSLPL